MNNDVELHMLIMEHNACAHARLWDPIAGQKMRSGQICSSCRRPLPQPHTPECKRCALCAGSHHVRMTFFRSSGVWHCRFYSGRWQPLPKRLTFRDAASVIETAVRGNGLIEDGVREALERSMKIGRGGLMLRLSREQYQAIGGVLPAAPAATNKTGAGAEGILPKAGSSQNQRQKLRARMPQDAPADAGEGCASSLLPTPPGVASHRTDELRKRHVRRATVSEKGKLDDVSSKFKPP